MISLSLSLSLFSSLYRWNLIYALCSLNLWHKKKSTAGTDKKEIQHRPKLCVRALLHYRYLPTICRQRSRSEHLFLSHSPLSTRGYAVVLEHFLNWLFSFFSQISSRVRERERERRQCFTLGFVSSLSCFEHKLFHRMHWRLKKKKKIFTHNNERIR